MLSPFLIIGVGGSGGKTIRAMRQTLLRRLRAKGWKGEFPEAWQFLTTSPEVVGMNYLDQ